MSDIVEELEAWIRPMGTNVDHPCIGKAIDEIKRLRADVVLWRERVEEGAMIIEANVTEIERLRADNARLVRERVALLSMLDSLGGSWPDAARRALEQARKE